MAEKIIFENADNSIGIINPTDEGIALGRRNRRNTRRIWRLNDKK